MWTIVKFKKKELNTFLKDLQSKLIGNIKYYLPKEIKTIKKNKSFVNKTSYLLEDYIFVYHKNFSNPKILSYLKNSKGLIYFLNDYIYSQKSINDFIVHCKKHEDQKGFISKSLSELINKKYYKFKSGPFENMIFQLLEKREKDLRVRVGKFDNLLLINNYNFEAI
tara:strand:- start:67 stop:564 length:498 start_codon:yes stop_codon:yes gene_type:complete